MLRPLCPCEGAKPSQTMSVRLVSCAYLRQERFLLPERISCVLRNSPVHLHDEATVDVSGGREVQRFDGGLHLRVQERHVQSESRWSLSVLSACTRLRQPIQGPEVDLIA